MSYYNLNLAAQKGLKPIDIINLQILSQARTEDVSNYLNTDVLTDFEDKGYVVYVKGKKSSKKEELARLSKKGQQILQDIQCYAVIEEDIILFDWMKNLYLGLGKEIGSESKCKKLIAWFRSESGISKNKLVILLKAFVEDEERIEWSKVLQYVFWVPAHRYQKDPALEDSKLWLYYEKHKEKFDKIFEQYE